MHKLMAASRRSVDYAVTDETMEPGLIALFRPSATSSAVLLARRELNALTFNAVTLALHVTQMDGSADEKIFALYSDMSYAAYGVADAPRTFLSTSGAVAEHSKAHLDFIEGSKKAETSARLRIGPYEGVLFRRGM